MYVRNACAIYLCSLLGEACEIVSDAPKCIYNLRFRWWCRRVCKYVTGICYQGNRHSVNRCNGMAGAVLLARSSFHSDSTSQLHMQEFLCVFVCVVACVWIRCELECSLAFLTIYALLCNISHFFIFAIAVFWFKSHMCFSASLGCFTALFPHLSPYSHPFICLSLPPQVSRPPFFSPIWLCLWVLKLIRVNRCRGCYLCFHLVWLSYKLSTGPAQCRSLV